MGPIRRFFVRVRAWLAKRRELAAAEFDAATSRQLIESLKSQLANREESLAVESQTVANLRGELEVLSDQLKILVAWQTAHLERLKTEAAIEASRRLPPKPQEEE